MEGIKKLKICRVCLSPTINYELIMRGTREIFVSLQPDINLEASVDPVICDDCTQQLAQVVDFKSTCLNMQDCIRSFPADDSVPLDLKLVCQIWSNGDRKIEIPENCTVCRFCMELVEDKHCTPLQMDDQDAVEVKSKLDKCGLQIDLSITTDPAICYLCQENLHMHVSLITTISEVEQQICSYFEVMGLEDKCKIDLMDVYRFVRGEFPNTTNRKFKAEELDENFFIKREDTDVTSDESILDSDL